MSDASTTPDARTAGTSPPWARHVAADLNVQYAERWDDSAFDEWIALFVDDATFDQRGRIATGVEAIQAMIGSGNPARPPGPGLHVMTNTLVTEAAASAIATTSDFQYLVWHDQTYRTFAAGRTFSRLVSTPDGWRITLRAVWFIGDDKPPGW